MKIKKKIIIFIMSISLLGLSSCAKKPINNNTDDKGKTETNISEVVDFALEMKNDVFTILQISDTQIIDSAQCRTPDRLSTGEKEKWATNTMEQNCFRVMRQAVNKVKPDLIVLVGDNVYGEFDDLGTSLTALISELESYKTPWAFTFGNHDNETRKGLEWTLKQYASAKYCLFKKGTVTGNSNYSIGVTADGKLKQVLFMLDTNGCGLSTDEGVKKEQGIFGDQIEWFNGVCERAKQFNGGVTVPNIGFSHIQTRAFADAMFESTTYQSKKNGYVRYAGGVALPSNFQPVKITNNSVGGFGEMRIDFDSLLDDDGKFYSAMLKNGTKGWYFGHEHLNNASIVNDDGVRFTYGLKTGFYDSYDRDMVGSTQIKLGDGVYHTEHIYYSEEA